MEMMVRTKAMGCIVAEVLISFVDRVYGESELVSTSIFPKTIFLLKESWVKQFSREMALLRKVILEKSSATLDKYGFTLLILYRVGTK